MDVFLFTFSEGCKSLILFSVIYFYLSKTNKNLIKFASLGIITSFLIAGFFLFFSIQYQISFKQFIFLTVNWNLFNLGILFLLFVTFYLKNNNLRVFTFYENFKKKETINKILIYFSCCWLFFFIFLNIAIQEDSFIKLKESYYFVFIFTILSLVVLCISFLIIKYFIKNYNLKNIFTPVTLFLFLFSYNLLASNNELTDPPLILLLNKVINTFTHDFLHIFFVIFQVPDHPYLNLSIYKLILFTVDKKISLLFLAIAIIFPIISFLFNLLGASITIPSELTSNVLRRKFKANVLQERKLKALIVFLSLVLIISSFKQAFSYKEKTFDPYPIPVVDDNKGNILCPLTDPFSSITNGIIRKYIYQYKGKQIIFFVIKKQDSKIVAALDYCEICQPEGYLQLSKNYLLCKYCKTPIPIATVGDDGGCNPLPLKVKVIKSTLKITVKDLLKQYAKVPKD